MSFVPQLCTGSSTMSLAEFWHFCSVSVVSVNSHYVDAEITALKINFIELNVVNNFKTFTTIKLAYYILIIL